MEFDFAPEVDSAETIPEQLRSLYAKDETSGKFKLPDAHKGVAEVYRGLKTALSAERKSKAKTVDLTPLSEFGSTPEEIAGKVKGTLKELQDQLVRGGSVNVEKIKKEFADQHAAELLKRDTRVTALQGQLYVQLVDNAATSEILDAKGAPALVLPFLRPHVRVVEEDGKANVYVIDAAGDRRYSAVTGQPMSMKELVLELKKNPTYGRLFDAEVPAGGGKDPKTPVKPAVLPSGETTAEQKIAAGLRARQR
jgi:hypothetical protein